MPAHFLSPPVASRHAWVGSAAVGPLNSVQERSISPQAQLLEVAANINTAMPALAQPILQQLLCIYMHDTATTSLNPAAPFASPDARDKHPPSPSGTGNVPATLTKPSRPPHWQSSRADLSRTSIKEGRRQNPRPASPRGDPA